MNPAQLLNPRAFVKEKGILLIFLSHTTSFSRFLF